MDNKITKAAAGGVASDAGSATAEELELINTYTRRTLTADEVYVFTVVLCDNDVDRDGERFTVESLFALEKLFVGKTGIFDHDPSAKNQTARIISCRVENVASRTTATGDEYFCLKARAYLPRTEGNSELIAALDQRRQDLPVDSGRKNPLQRLRRGYRHVPSQKGSNLRRKALLRRAYRAIRRI